MAVLLVTDDAMNTTIYKVTLKVPTSETDPDGIGRLKRVLKWAWRSQRIKCDGAVKVESERKAVKL